MANPYGAERDPQTERLSEGKFCYAFDVQEIQSLGLLGNKGRKLAEMTRMGFPVPPGFTITTLGWREYKKGADGFSSSLWDSILQSMRELEGKAGRKLGDSDNPLFVSVRSGAKESMPGQLATIINVGINDRTVEALGREIGINSAWEAYFELIANFGLFRFGVDEEAFKSLRERETHLFGVSQLNQLPPGRLQRIVEEAKERIRKEGYEFPQDAIEQLKQSVQTVFSSWDYPRVAEYRRECGIADEAGTAVNVQVMVWGNSLREGAGSGVLITRNPKLLTEEPVVDFVPRVQGTKVVGVEAGGQTRTINELNLPVEVKNSLGAIARTLDGYYERPQDIEFTYDGENIWILQTRDAPLSNVAWFRYLRERIHSGEEEVLVQRKINARQLLSLFEYGLDEEAVEMARKNGRLLSRGIGVTVGIARGQVVTSLEEAREQEGAVVLVAAIELRHFQKVPGNVVGIVASNGSVGSHIARWAERLSYRRNLQVIFGADTKNIIAAAGVRNKFVTVDGGTGQVFLGRIRRDRTATLLAPDEREIAKRWLDERRRNPWRFIAREEVYRQFLAVVAPELRKITGYHSRKAREVEAANILLPPSIRMNYEVLEAKGIKAQILADEVKARVERILAKGSDVTVRTGHHPDRSGGGPWVLITKPRELEKFFSDPEYSKYGGFAEIVSDPQLTEIIVGEVPKDKLRPNKRIQRQHGTWTLACTEMGEILLQIRPFSPHLREHDSAEEEELISFTVRLDSDNGETPRLFDANTEVKKGEALVRSSKAGKLALLVWDTVVRDWWPRHELPSRMAVASEFFHPPSSGIPVLEGQARIGPRGESWCLVYGIKSL